MNRVRKFLALSSDERMLHVRALCLIAIVRMGLWLLPFRTLQKILMRISWQSKQRFSSSQIAVAIQRTSLFVPHSTCLVQALAAEMLFHWQGELVRLTIGVAAGGRSIEAHAWLEKEGSVIIGNTVDLQRYKPLTAFENGKSSVRLR